MTVEIATLCFGAQDPPSLTRFWAAVLLQRVVGEATLRPDGLGFAIRFVATDEPKSRANQMHLDLTSTSPEDQEAIVERALAAGSSHLDVGQLPDEDHVVLADPEGNEFCVVGPGNAFLADTGVIGCVSSDGTRAVGHFWSRALDWPLVWDQDEETAIQSPRGGTKISWGGPPVAPRTGPDRLFYELWGSGDDRRKAEAARLVSLGAGQVDGVSFTDPDGNEFVLVERP